MTVWVGTSWKMNKTLSEAIGYVDELLGFPLPTGVQPFLLPPHTALAAVRDRLPENSSILLGAQNAHWAPEGPGTGEISMRMAMDAGAKMIEIGHSERRESFGETDETVALKTAAAVAHGLIPLICVGEPLDVRRFGEAETYVASQVRAALCRIAAEDVSQVIIAYEPIWAIGEHGHAATAAEIGPVMSKISEVVDETSGGSGARALLYGGSVNQANASTLMEDPHTDGLFVGRAAWTAAGFAALLDMCAGTPVNDPSPYHTVRST